MNAAGRITRLTSGPSIGEPQADLVAVEEPLEIRLGFGSVERRMRVTLGITMRTPGHDLELAAGFLLAEGIVRERVDVLDARQTEANAVKIELHPRVAFDADRVRRFTVSSACGMCGTRTLDDLDHYADTIPASVTFPAAKIHLLSAKLREAQSAFDCTGGSHAAGLFDTEGNLLLVREDVGRHNAVDKLVGFEWLAGRVPLAGRMVFVSGRAGYELVQKAVVAGVEVLAAVGAPTTLAVDAAERFGLTLLGFVREGRFNIYSGVERIVV
ncbi:MAG: formate dehydrogenase accessory sulfurtransferase FdhD [Fimbriiglobus sp.]|jgi:FdhD protein|nr:formate dehydrogenase accessory sulfurtransferase FdhD [Fimbriiglobus sp.]